MEEVTPAVVPLSLRAWRDDAEVYLSEDVYRSRTTVPSRASWSIEDARGGGSTPLGSGACAGGPPAKGEIDVLCSSHCAGVGFERDLAESSWADSERTILVIFSRTTGSLFKQPRARDITARTGDRSRLTNIYHVTTPSSIEVKWSLARRTLLAVKLAKELVEAGLMGHVGA